MEVSMHMNKSSLILHMNINDVHRHKSLFSKSSINYIISCKVVGMQSTDHNLYQVLSLPASPNVGFDEIKKAYKSKALKYHPDVCILTKEESTKRFVELRQAYEVLSDPNSRRIYDMGLEVDPSGSDGDDQFPREVWERQLSGLRMRCNQRMLLKKKQRHTS